ncbi:hypothetical protein [Azospirillum sp. ST 5-10]|uniref:hypothetical protein n=1 Tax=unclassified Azospirillum TaxID=2630922 RepID=UPI003F4A16C8
MPATSSRAIVRHAIRFHLRFTPSHRDDEDRLAERGIEVPYDTARRRVATLGPVIAGTFIFQAGGVGALRCAKY